MLFISCTNNYIGNTIILKKLVYGDLWNGFPTFFANFFKTSTSLKRKSFSTIGATKPPHDFILPFLFSNPLLIFPVNCPILMVFKKCHQFLSMISSNQRIVALVNNIFFKVSFFRNGKWFHQLPSFKIRATYTFAFLAFTIFSRVFKVSSIGVFWSNPFIKYRYI